MQRKIEFNQGWKFHLGDESESIYKQYDDSKWREVTLPHDWSIEFDFDKTSLGGGSSGFLNGGIGWYRKIFTLPKTMENRRISIDFGGVYMDSSLYVNGNFIGNYPNGYTPFSYDITEQLVMDGITENIITVKVVNQEPSSRWYSGSGIYRNVYLTCTHPIHVNRYGTFITTPNLAKAYANHSAEVCIQTVVSNKTSVNEKVSIQTSIYDQEGQLFGEMVRSEINEIVGGKQFEYHQNMMLPQPILWDVNQPYCYTVKTEVCVNGEIVDVYYTPFGFRWYTFDKDEGFSLNGKAMKLHGVCMHHDQGALGAAAHYRAIERQMEIMKEMGVNAIRVTHNPAADELLQICNKLGLLVIDEAFDVWETPKRKYDYARYFDQLATHPEARPGMTWAEYDIKEMVKRGKNEPCIIVWSLGNEIIKASVETASKLDKWVKEVDPTRPTTQGHNTFIWGFDAEGHDAKVANVADIVGFNYGERMYDSARKAFPDWKMLGSENSSATRTRGEYGHPQREHVEDNHPDYQQSSYDNDRMSWGSTMQDAWKADRDRKYIAGEFIWTGFDYIGEPSPYFNMWPAKSSYFGIVDTAGFKKDAFYMYQSQWCSVKNKPIVHILPHWNWEEDTSIMVEGKIPVHVYSNAMKVELFLNGDSLTEKSFIQKEIDGKIYQESEEQNIYLEWLVPYEPGELKAVAKDESDRIVAVDIIKTAKEAKKIQLLADRDEIVADSKDLVYITANILDEEGNFVPHANSLIHFEVIGEGKIVGVDNGNPIAVDERYKDTKRKAFNGKALVIVQSTDKSGEISLLAKCEGLSSSSITIHTVKQTQTIEETEIEKLDITSDKNVHKVIAYEQMVIKTEKGILPQLPEKIKARTEAHTIQEVSVVWNEIKEENLLSYGKFEIRGKVDGQELQPTLKVIVRGIIGIQKFSTAIPKGILPKLPKKVKVYFSDDTIDELNVMWEPYDLKQVNECHTFTIKGKIADRVYGVDEEIETTISIRVSQDTVKGEDYLRYKNGFFWPAPIASYTDLEGGSSVKCIHEDQATGKWSNYSLAPRSKDWVGIIIGKETEEKQFIDNLEIEFYSDDESILLPEAYHIQYYTQNTIDTPRYDLDRVPEEHLLNQDNNWKDIENLIAPKTLSSNQTNYFTFDMVETYAIRIKLISQPNKYVGIKKIRGFEKRVNPHHSFKVESIRKPNEIKVSDNASVTIIKSAYKEQPVKAIITAEDGITSQTYEL